MSKIMWFLKTLAYGFAVLIALGAVFTALSGWRSDPLPLIVLAVIAVGYVGYRFIQGYAAGREE